MTQINPTLYELDVNALRLALKDIEDEVGITYPDTHRHNTEVVLSGTTYARSVEFINGYTITFEDGQYAVRCVGANHNIADVKNLNQVSLIIGNSAGLQTVNIGGGVGTVEQVADAVWNAIAANYLIPGSTGEKLAAAGSAGDPWSTILASYNTAGTAGKIIKDIAAAEDNILSGIRDISVATSAINSIASGFILTQGTVVTGTYITTRTPDGVYHTIDSNANGIDITYNFDIGINSAPSSFTLFGFSIPQNHTVQVQAYNFVTLTWDIVGSISGAHIPASFSGTLFPHNNGTLPGEIGDVRLRLFTTQTGTSISVDQIYVSYSVLPPQTGYSGHVVSATTNTLILGAAASNINNYYTPCLLYVNHGTGAGQYAKAVGYVGSTRTLQLELPMATVLDSSSHITLQAWANSSISQTSINAIANEVRTELTPELTHILTLENNPGLTATQATMLLEMYELLGLNPTKPLVVTQSTRTAGTISQSIATNSTQTVVTRV